MSQNSQPRRSGTNKRSVLSRPPVSSSPAGDADISVIGSRVVRLLRDARASVQARPRLDTPLNREPLTTQPLLPPARGRRFPTMNSSSSAVMSLSSSSSAPQLLTSNQQMDRTAFELSLDAAKGAPEAQLEKLAQLKRWLANPQHALWDGAVTRLLDVALLPSTDSHVSMRAVAILLRGSDVRRFAGLPLVARRLHELCESSVDGQQLEELLMRESLLQPLLNLLNEEELLKRQPHVLWDVLEILRCCSRNSSTILSQLVSLGVISGVNTVVRRIMSCTNDSPLGASSNEDSFVRALLPPLCLLYRNLSTQYSSYLLKLGSLDLIVDILDRFLGDADVMQAAARAIAKTVFDDCCLEHFKKDTRACSAVVAALGMSAELSGLAVSRFCGTLARLLERSRELRDWLMRHHNKKLVQLVRMYMTPQGSSSVVSSGPLKEEEGAHLDDLLQSVMWLVGVAAVSEECSTAFVLEITSLLAQFLKDLDVTMWRLTFIYTLMCLSNLSFFFVTVEKTEGGKEALAELYATLGFVLAGVVFEGDVEATVEATRVLGNISLTNTGRDWIETNRCDEVCIVFLGHEDPRIVYNCFGVLLNLTATDTCRVVADPELMRMLLQHTGRYTREEYIAAEKAKEILLQTNISSSDEDSDLSYTEQIAAVVEKLLLNIHGIL